MRILFLSENFPPETNAAATRVYERAVHWARWGNSVTVITSAPNFPEGRLHEGYSNRFQRTNEDGIEVVRVPTVMRPNEGSRSRILDQGSYMVSSFITASTLRAKFDVVAATSPQLLVGISGAGSAAVRRLPYVLEVSDLTIDQARDIGAISSNVALRLMRKLDAMAIGRADHVVLLSEAFRGHVEQYMQPSAEMSVITNGVEIDKYRPCTRDDGLCHELGLDQYTMIVGYLGNLGPSQDLLEFLRAVEILQRRGVTEIGFLIVGAGAQGSEIRQRLIELNLSHVRVVDRQPKNEIQRYWSLCDLALVHLANRPVFSTVIPSKMFEAMAQEIPLFLVAPEGQASELVRSTDAGIWVRAGEPAEVANALLQVSNDSQLRHRLAANGLQAAPEHSRENQAERFLKVLREATDRA